MQLDVDSKTGEVSFALDAELYPRETVEGAAHAFSTRARVFVSENDGVLELTLETLSPLDDPGLRRLAGDFLNEALSQCLHLRLLAENRRLNELILTTAFHAARRDPADPLQPGAAVGDELSAEQQSEGGRLEREADAEVAQGRKQ